MAEMLKRPGRELELGLDGGRYLVYLAQGGKLAETTVELAAGRTVELAPAAFRPSVRQPTRSRGDDRYAEVPESRRRVNPYAVLSSRVALAPDKKVGLAAGMQLGLRLDDRWRLGLAGVFYSQAQVNDWDELDSLFQGFPDNVLSYWGLAAQVAIPADRTVRLTLGGLVGFDSRSLVVEPQVGLEVVIARLVGLQATLSKRFGPGEGIDGLAVGFGLVFTPH